MEAAAGAGNAGRGKDIENIIKAEEEVLRDEEQEMDLHSDEDYKEENENKVKSKGKELEGTENKETAEVKKNASEDLAEGKEEVDDDVETKKEINEESIPVVDNDVAKTVKPVVSFRSF